jgi:hypothetical protein
MTPTARTLAQLGADGWTCAVAEAWVPGANVRRDLLGLFDVVAVRADRPGVLGIQATSRPNHAARVHKLLALPALAVWLAAGNTAEVWSWGKRSGHWQCRRQVLELSDPGDVLAVPTPTRPRQRRKGNRQQELFGPV